MVAEALIRGGHKRLAYVEGKTDTSTNKDRKAGFIEGIRASGLRKHVVEVAGEYSYEAGHRAGLRLLRYAKDVDAIFCANDILALGLLDAIRYSGGLEVPDEMSVIGFDDIRAASWPVYNLTTVRQPVDEMLEALISKLDKLDLAADERDHANIVIPGKLVARSSARLTQDYIDA